MASFKLYILAALVSLVAVKAEFCKDNNVWCKYMSKYGACSWNEDTVKACPRTCDKCSVECKNSNGLSRKECGYIGIQRDECFTKGCCWDPLEEGEDGAWCYESLDNKLE